MHVVKLVAIFALLVVAALVALLVLAEVFFAHPVGFLVGFVGLGLIAGLAFCRVRVVRVRRGSIERRSASSS